VILPKRKTPVRTGENPTRRRTQGRIQVRRRENPSRRRT